MVDLANAVGLTSVSAGFGINSGCLDLDGVGLGLKISVHDRPHSFCHV